MFEAVIVDPLREPLPPAWADLVKDAELPVLWDPGLLESLAWFSRHPTLMAVVTDGGRPCALFCARHRGPLPPRRFGDPAGRRLPGIVECHLLPFVTTPGFAFHPELDVAGRAASVKAFERAVAARLGPRCAGFVYRQVTEEERPVFAGRIIRAGQPDAVIDNRWGSVEEYLGDLPRRDRKRLQRLDRMMRDDTEVVRAVEASIDGVEASRLFNVVQYRHPPRFATPVPVPPLYYDLMSGRSGVSYYTYRTPESDLIAYGLLVDDGRTLRCHGWGTLDQADGGRPHLYFDHFLRQVYHLIDEGRDQMIMGKSMFDIKRRFGARLAPLYAVATLR